MVNLQARLDSGPRHRSLCFRQLLRSCATPDQPPSPQNLPVRFVIPIQDLILLPGAEELADLAPDVQQAKLAALFPFLPPGSTFTVESGEVTIEVPDAGSSELTEAERLATKAEKRA